MIKVTLVFAILLIALGLAHFLGTGGHYPTALIPAWFGVALGFGGLLAISPNESRRKLFMHINVTIGLIGFLGGAFEVVRGYVRATFAYPTEIVALASKLTLTALMLIYVVLCVRSFAAARRTGKV
jgi:hypothetical protein